MTRKLDHKILEKVKNVLEIHKGRNEAIPSHEIAKIVDIEPGASNITIRSYITEVVRKYGIPVATAGKKGYFLIENEEELQLYLQSLKGRIDEIENRIAWTATNYENFYGVKLSFKVKKPKKTYTLEDLL